MEIQVFYFFQSILTPFDLFSILMNQSFKSFINDSVPVRVGV